MIRLHIARHERGRAMTILRRSSTIAADAYRVGHIGLRCQMLFDAHLVTPGNVQVVTMGLTPKNQILICTIAAASTAKLLPCGSGLRACFIRADYPFFPGVPPSHPTDPYVLALRNLSRN